MNGRWEARDSGLGRGGCAGCAGCRHRNLDGAVGVGVASWGPPNRKGRPPKPEGSRTGLLFPKRNLRAAMNFFTVPGLMSSTWSSGASPRPCAMVTRIGVPRNAASKRPTGRSVITSTIVPDLGRAAFSLRDVYRQDDGGLRGLDVHVAGGPRRRGADVPRSSRVSRSGRSSAGSPSRRGPGSASDYPENSGVGGCRTGLGSVLPN